jgi:transcriptional regulator with XRE-family HTH domain
MSCYAGIKVAEHLSIGLEAVSRMERGLVVPTIVRLAELAQLFDCDIAELLLQKYL